MNPLFHTLVAFAFPLWISPPAQDDSILAGKVEEIRFTSQQFAVAGNLYLPSAGRPPHPMVMWVSGSGPSTRTVKNPETIKLVNVLLDRGVAYFRIDKPGSGDSRGILNDASVFAQLSTIVVDAYAILRKHPLIDSGKIGLFGSSQAGYIMPIVLSRVPGISFMIGSSCPGENSIDQWNYLLERQLVCQGLPPERSLKTVAMFSRLRSTTSKREFDEAIAYFDRFPMVIKSLGYDSSFSQRARTWWPREIDPGDESHFNPMTLIEKSTVPLYLVYGSRDKQIDPDQAIRAYKSACNRSGNSRLKIVLLPNSDHNMSLSDGCLNTVAALNKVGQYRLDPEYLETIRGWIEELTGPMK